MENDISESFAGFGETVNDAFFFVIDKIISIQAFFIGQAYTIGKLVLLIALLSAGLNYALTGQGLKENAVKILKATLFFLIVTAAYPTIIGFITSWTFSLAERSVGSSVRDYFNEVVDYVKDERTIVVSGQTVQDQFGTPFIELSRTEILGEIIRDKNNLLSGLTEKRRAGNIDYTAVAPASALKIILFIANDCIGYAEGKTKMPLPFNNSINVVDFSRVTKGLICAFFIIITGAFALLEYLVCFLEFMLVASVGIILFPLSIWEGSKFMSEKFIGALMGFFIKMLFCNIAIFLLVYGYVSIFNTIQKTGFAATVDQIVFIIFSSLLFFYICKSAPGIAQSLLTGTPSLSATGAISAAAGAVAAVGATAKLAKKAGNSIIGGGAKLALGGIGDFKEANAARNAVKDAGGGWREQGGAFINSLDQSAGDRVKAGALGLTRSLLGVERGVNPHSWTENFQNQKNSFGENYSFHEHFNDRRTEGAERGRDYAAKHHIGSAGRPPAPETPATAPPAPQSRA